MRVRIIEDLAALDDLRDRWRSVYFNDRTATVFQSWGWLRGWLGATMTPWTVLVLEPSGEPQPVGFFAFYSQDYSAGLGGLRDPQVRLAGDPLADYSGILCLPEYEDAVVTAIRDYISKELRSCRLTLREIADPRLVRIVEGLDRQRHSVLQKPATPCPRVLLPESWDQYLANNLESGFSRTLKRKLNKATRLGCVVHDGDDLVLTDHIEAFLDMSEARWGAQGSARRQQVADTLTSCYEEGLLETKALSYEQRTVAIQVSLLDNRNRIYHFYNGGRHPGFDHLSPGMVLHGHCIRQAIERGYAAYDFMRGAESYKYSYGARDVFTRNFVVASNAWGYRLERRARNFLGSARKSLRNLASRVPR